VLVVTVSGFVFHSRTYPRQIPDTFAVHGSKGVSSIGWVMIGGLDIWEWDERRHVAEVMLKHGVCIVIDM
jgi:hypothetical protein